MVTWRKQAWALALAGWGIALMVAHPGPRHALSMGAYLLVAWLEAFVPRAPLFQPLKKTVRGYRDGTYPVPSLRETLVAAASFSLMVAAIFAPE